jgi:GntR family transcriptional repressor for pyruvate dehydrogenase complex
MKKKILDEVYDQLLSLINNGNLKPGEQLPPERVLARDLKVSRQSIREALKRAESKGLVRFGRERERSSSRRLLI